MEDVEIPEERRLDDDEEAILEDEKEAKSTETTKVLVGKWEHINSQPPLWMRYVLPIRCIMHHDKSQYWLSSEPKSVSDEEYELLYQTVFKDFQKPLAWTHFTGDTGTGVSFRALLYIPRSVYACFL